MRIIFFVLVLLCSTPSFAQHLSAYKIYDKKGEESSFKEMVEFCSKKEVVLFGELHNVSLAHWLQLQTTEYLYILKDGNIVLGAEMFESDNQLLLDEYINGDIQTRHFEKEARLWNNYKTDYKPLVEFAKKNGLSFIATNIPRRYAAKVFAEGLPSLDSLSKNAKNLFPPTPIQVDMSLPGYKALLDMSGDPSHKSLNFPHAQAVKDATMGYFIIKNLQQDHIFIHYNGSYHSDNYEGIGWYLNHYKPGTTSATITTVLQQNINQLEEKNIGVADFIICIPNDMTKTY